jgi:hypothetical protein
MQADIKEQRRLLEPEQILKQNQVAGTAHRQKFGQPLDGAENDRFNSIQRFTPLWLMIDLPYNVDPLLSIGRSRIDQKKRRSAVCGAALAGLLCGAVLGTSFATLTPDGSASPYQTLYASEGFYP